MTDTHSVALSKVPEVTLGFWIIKIFATTLGEVGGNAVTMQLGFGYLIGSMIFAAVLGSRLIKSTIRGRLQGRRMLNSFGRACRIVWRCA